MALLASSNSAVDIGFRGALSLPLGLEPCPHSHFRDTVENLLRMRDRSP